MRKAVVAITLAAVAGSVVLTHSGTASAQTTGNVSYVTPTAKGITGCALLGGEAVALVEAAVGVRARWAYIVGPLLGMAAGGVGGYFLESAAGTSPNYDPTLTGISVGTLVLGLGLVVPSVIAYISATTYRPEADTANEDNAPTNAPIDESTGAQGAPAEGGANTQPAAPASGSGGGANAPSGGASTTPSPSTSGGTSMVHPGGSGRRMARVLPAFRPTGLLDFGTRGFAVGLPSISVENSVSQHDMRQYGLAPQSELRVPLLSGAF